MIWHLLCPLELQLEFTVNVIDIEMGINVNILLCIFLVHFRPVGMPIMQQVLVQNTDTKNNLHLLSISGSTVHFHCSFFQEKVSMQYMKFVVLILSYNCNCVTQTLKPTKYPYKKRRKIPTRHSNTEVENKLTRPWPKNNIENWRQKFMNPTKNLGWIQVSSEG